MTTPPRRHVVCREVDLPPGAVREIQLGGRAIGVLNIDGELFAIRNSCPHQGAPLCRGTVAGTMLASRPQEWIYGMEGQVLRCPWHGWEFDLATGRSLVDPERRRVRTYDVEVIDGDIVLVLTTAARRPLPPAAPLDLLNPGEPQRELDT
jgi:nitrite reductase (NADH) small subunit